MSIDRRTLVVSLLALGVVAAAPQALAAPPGPDGFVRTGEGVQTASHWPFTVDVFVIAHEIKTVPDVKTRQAMIELDVDKRFSLRMLRDLDAAKLRSGLRDGYRRNGYSDGERMDRLFAGVPDGLPKGKRMSIGYDAAAKETRLVVDGAATATVDGVAFMKATWSIWFGKSKPATLGDELVKEL
jgi:hypothetical protein